MNWDLKNSPLEIKTNSVLGSGDDIDLHFSSSVGYPSGLVISFDSQPRLWISFCSSKAMGYFQKPLPSDKDRVWRITLNKETGIRLQIHCNEVEVLDFIMSDSTCKDSSWRKNWGGDIVIVQFTDTDTASDCYRPQPKRGD